MYSRPDCPLCQGLGGQLLARRPGFRVVWPDEPGHPGLIRVIWDAHVAEMSELALGERTRVMAAVFEIEALMRQVLEPDKVNLASLGNRVAHLHWHVIPRWRDDLHFPDSIWTAPPALEPGSSRVAVARARVEQASARLPLFHQAVRAAFPAC